MDKISVKKLIRVKHRKFSTGLPSQSLLHKPFVSVPPWTQRALKPENYLKSLPIGGQVELGRNPAGGSNEKGDGPKEGSPKA